VACHHDLFLLSLVETSLPVPLLIELLTQFKEAVAEVAVTEHEEAHSASRAFLIL
jgi:hypothetical protein